MSLGLEPPVIEDIEDIEADTGGWCGGLKGLLGEGIAGRAPLGVEGGKVGEGGIDAPKCLVSFMWVVRDWRLG